MSSWQERERRRRAHVAVQLELATGGLPPEALLGGIGSIGPQPGLTRVAILHDDGCPCTEHGRPMLACTCEIVELRVLDLGLSA